MTNIIGVPTPVDGCPGYCIYDVGEDVAIMQIGQFHSIQVARVPSWAFLAGGIGYVRALIDLYEKAQKGTVHLDESGEYEPPVFNG